MSKTTAELSFNNGLWSPLQYFKSTSFLGCGRLDQLFAGAVLTGRDRGFHLRSLNDNAIQQILQGPSGTFPLLQFPDSLQVFV